MIEVDMNFLGNVAMPCDACQGQCYNRGNAGSHLEREIHCPGAGPDRGRSGGILFLPAQSRRHPEKHAGRRAGIPQSQPQGGHPFRRRIPAHKIAAELAKAPAWKLEEDGKRALFILDEPTSGLHFNEVALLLAALFRLRDAGHTILCVEHHKDLLNAADYLVDMGPGAGRHGGNIVAEGSPQM